MQFYNTGERKYPRYDHCSRIRYILDHEPHRGVFDGVTRNISLGGLCLYVFESLGEGQKIQIISKLPVDSQTAALRWINKVDDFYESGFMFVD